MLKIKIKIKTKQKSSFMVFDEKKSSRCFELRCRHEFYI